MHFAIPKHGHIIMIMVTVLCVCVCVHVCVLCVCVCALVELLQYAYWLHAFYLRCQIVVYMLMLESSLA